MFEFPRPNARWGVLHIGRFNFLKKVDFINDLDGFYVYLLWEALIINGPDIFPGLYGRRILGNTAVFEYIFMSLQITTNLASV